MDRVRSSLLSVRTRPCKRNTQLHVDLPGDEQQSDPGSGEEVESNEAEESSASK